MDYPHALVSAERVKDRIGAAMPAAVLAGVTITVNTAFSIRGAPISSLRYQ